MSGSLGSGSFRWFALLWSAQTPQTFRTELIRRAYEPLIRQRLVVTDDAAAVERLGHPVFLVECDTANLKITISEDLPLAEAILARRESSVKTEKKVPVRVGAIADGDRSASATPPTQ